jgi:exodeoxyribonuclease V alpha subunit
MVTRNQPALGVFNGDIGIVLRTPWPAGAVGAADEAWGDATVTPIEPGLSSGVGAAVDRPAPPSAGAAMPSVLRAWFLDGDTLRSVSVGRLADVETAFAMTVHKSQGSEFAHVALVLPDEDVPVLTRELLYTGITRARTAFTLVGPQGRLPGLVATAAARRTRRVSGLRDRIERD